MTCFSPNPGVVQDLGHTNKFMNLLMVKLLTFSNRMKELGIAQDAGKVSFGQLYGMCDQVSFLLGKDCVLKKVVNGCVTGDDICHVS